jgi:hypothetical protein
MSLANPFYPHTIINVTSLDNLQLLEEMVADTIAPDMDDDQLENWDKREPIQQFLTHPIRPEYLDAIQLQVMDNPYDHLRFSSVLGREIRSSAHFGGIKRHEFVEPSGQFSRLARETIGLTLLAEGRAHDSKSRQLQTELYYLPVLGPGLNRPRQLHPKMAIKRYVALPRVVSGKNMAKFDTISRRVGLEAMRGLPANADLRGEIA